MSGKLAMVTTNQPFLLRTHKNHKRYKSNMNSQRRDHHHAYNRNTDLLDSGATKGSSGKYADHKIRVDEGNKSM